MPNWSATFNIPPTIARLFQKVPGILWVMVLVTLPLTSFPPFARVTGGIVAPFAAILVFFLLLVWLIPYICRGGRLPKECLGLVIFILVALVASSSAFFLNIPSLKGKNISDQEVRAFVTLAMGFGFYLIFASFPADEKQLSATMKWLNIGGIIIIFWTMMQAYFIFTNSDYPAWFNSVQNAIAEKAPYLKERGQRVSALTYEASWFGHQMVMLYIPLWLASSYHRYSAFKLRFFHISIENILLVIGIGLFFLSSPRISLVALALMVIFIFIKMNFSIYHWILHRVALRRNTALNSRFSKMLIALGVGLVMFGAYAAFIIGIVYVSSQRDWRVAALLNQPINKEEFKSLLSLDENTILNLSMRFAFFERTAYWTTGWHIFNDYPWLGVGLGNSGFFFQQKMPSLGYVTYEIRAVFYQNTALPNIKSLWFKLLSETGITGFFVFLSWLVLLWRSAGMSASGKQQSMRIIALMGQLSLLAFIAEGLSIDSFAMPYLWVMAGLISAVGMSFRRQLKQRD
jgi:hypothetical protein